MEYSSFQFTVKDLNKTYDFYRNVLGFDIDKVSNEDDFDFIIMKRDGFELIFEQESVVLQLHPKISEEWGKGKKGSGVALNFVVDNLYEIYGRIRANKVKIIYDIAEKHYGMREVWIYDPDKYLLVLSEPMD